MAKKEKLSITRLEYRALDQIRGLSTDAHYIVMCAKPTKDGRWILEGTDEAFDALTSDLSEEIGEQLSPPSRSRHLEKLYARLSPDAEF